MISATNFPTAKIYKFPTRPEIATFGFRSKLKSAGARAVHAIEPVVFGSGWYHDAAIEDERTSSGR